MKLPINIRRMNNKRDMPLKSFTAQKKQLVKQRGCICQECKKDMIDWFRCEIDHILPVAMGGDDEDLNLYILCQGCHKEKTRKDIIIINFAKRLGILEGGNGQWYSFFDKNELDEFYFSHIQLFDKINKRLKEYHNG